MSAFPKIQQPLFAAMLCAVSFAAFAQTPAPVGGTTETAPEWSESDSNRDGFLSKDELVPFPGVVRAFEKIDTDGDGKLSEAEYADWRDSSKR
ncbi:MAG: EF-hand domain-containing protein [Dokdonella sp.]